MENIIAEEFKQIKFKTIILNIIFILALYLTPTISHFLSLPIYLFEPMRIIIVLAIVHTNRLNAIFLALTLPLFSYLFSGHPMFPKFMIVMMELFVNVLLYYYFLKFFSNHLLYNWKKVGFVFATSMMLSTILSKMLYYLIKIALIKIMLLESEIISTPIYIQIIVAIALSVYILVFYRVKNK
jgi:hypothetical protein